MSNITEHEWNGIDVIDIGIDDDGDICIDTPNYYKLYIFKKDSIAIAKHFYSQLTTKQQKNAFLDEITSSE